MMQETLDNILEAISETVRKINLNWYNTEKLQSLSMPAALLACTYKVLSESYYVETECDDDAEEEAEP